MRFLFVFGCFVCLVVRFCYFCLVFFGGLGGAKCQFD